jgi:hypothetical protein
MSAVLSKVNMIRQSQSWAAVFVYCSSERSPGQARITFMSILWILYRDLLDIRIDLTCKCSDPSHSCTLEIHCFGFFSHTYFTSSLQTKLANEKNVLAGQVKKLMRDVAKVSDACQLNNQD